VTIFGDANRDGLVLIGVETSNHRGGRRERDFMFTGSSAEKYAYAQSLYSVRGHKSFLFGWAREPDFNVQL